MKKVLCLMSCAVLLSGALNSVAAEKPSVTLVDDLSATKVVKAVSLVDVIIELKVTPLDECIVISEPVSELCSVSSVAVKTVKLYAITPESSAYRVRPPTKATTNCLAVYRPPANISHAEV